MAAFPSAVALRWLLCLTSAWPTLQVRLARPSGDVDRHSDGIAAGENMSSAALMLVAGARLSGSRSAEAAWPALLELTLLAVTSNDSIADRTAATFGELPPQYHRVQLQALRALADRDGSLSAKALRRIFKLTQLLGGDGSAEIASFNAFRALAMHPNSRRQSLAPDVFGTFKFRHGRGWPLGCADLFFSFIERELDSALWRPDPDLIARVAATLSADDFSLLPERAATLCPRILLEFTNHILLYASSVILDDERSLALPTDVLAVVREFAQGATAENYRDTVRLCAEYSTPEVLWDAICMAIPSAAAEAAMGFARAAARDPDAAGRAVARPEALRKVSACLEPPHETDVEAWAKKAEAVVGAMDAGFAGLDGARRRAIVDDLAAVCVVACRFASQACASGSCMDAAARLPLSDTLTAVATVPTPST